MMKTTRILPLLLVVLFAVTACQKDGLVAMDPLPNSSGNGSSNGGTDGTIGTSGPTGSVKPKTSVDPGVYIVGSKSAIDYPPEPKPMLWSDNNPFELAYIQASALALCVKGPNIYVAGVEYLDGNSTNAVYWYNGRIIRLTYNGFNRGSAKAVAIAASGNDIYIAGNAATLGGSYRPVYWKNGEQIPLTAPGSSTVTGMVVKGDDIYISGYNSRGACYWKNGLLHNMEDNVADSYATGIAVDDNDNIYISGYVRGVAVPRNPGGPIRPVYWKNNTMITLPIDVEYTRAYGIAVNGSNVYVSGTTEDSKKNTKGVVWTNGTPAFLPGALTATCIYAINNEVYVAGTRPIDFRTIFGVVWKGDEVIAQGSLTSFNAILVIK